MPERRFFRDRFREIDRSNFQTIATNLETVYGDCVQSAGVRRHLQVPSVEASTYLSDSPGRQTRGQVSQGRLLAS